MSPGPAKNFDPDEALETARNVFWRNGYAGTAISELESALGVGRKSLYDTFGSKRELYLRSLEHYTDTVVQRICASRPHSDSEDEAVRAAARKAIRMIGDSLDRGVSDLFLELAEGYYGDDDAVRADPRTGRPCSSRRTSPSGSAGRRRTSLCCSCRARPDRCRRLRRS